MIMKKNLLTLVMLVSALFCSAQDREREAIHQVVMNAYVEATQNLGSIETIRSGFHPSFTMLRLLENDVKPLSLEEWIKAIEQRRKDAGGKMPRTEGKILTIDIIGSAATVKIELHREGKHIFTDYLALYKFTEGWRIVSKTFYRHPD